MKSYWECYKQKNPTKAAEIESLGLDFTYMPDNDVKEKIFSLETTAIDSECTISELKKLFFQQYDGKIEEGGWLYLMEYYDKKTFDEANTLNIYRTNTIWMIVERWILDRVEEIERKYASMPPRSKKDARSLILQFNLENNNEFSVFRKKHIYLNNYPMTTINKEYVKYLAETFDIIFKAKLKPLADNDDKKDASLYNYAISMQAFMTSMMIKKEYKDELIEECNGHDVSFYEELDIASDRAIAKYSIKE